MVAVTFINILKQLSRNSEAVPLLVLYIFGINVNVLTIPSGILFLAWLLDIPNLVATWVHSAIASESHRSRHLPYVHIIVYCICAIGTVLLVFREVDTNYYQQLGVNCQTLTPGHLKRAFRQCLGRLILTKVEIPMQLKGSSSSGMHMRRC
jgi:hypothetical protein